MDLSLETQAHVYFLYIISLRVNDMLFALIFFLNRDAYNGGDLLPTMAINMSLIDLLSGHF